MPRYADASRCPDCAAVLPAAPDRCPSCALPLSGPVAGPLAGQLLTTLARADTLLLELHELRRVEVGVQVGVEVGAESARLRADSAESSARVGATSRRLGDDGRRTGLGAPSVPKILLGLGAVCLLVAAVIFLAVAWSWLGVGGRTAVLLTATLATGALGVRLARRDLRVGGEALTAVALGLLLLDLAGAQDAGWLGDLDGGGLALLVGLVLAAAGGGLLLALPRDRRRLVVPQVAVVVGAVVAVVAAHAVSDRTTLVLGVEVVAAAGLVRVALGRRVALVVGGATGLGVLTWVALGLWALSEAVPYDVAVTLGTLWVDGDGLALAVATALALMPLAVLPGSVVARRAGLGLAAVVATGTLVLPVVDNGPSAVAVTTLAVLLAWTAVAFVLGRVAPGAAGSRGAVLAPVGVTALLALGLVTAALARSVATVVGVGGGVGSGAVFGETAGVRLDPVGSLGSARPALDEMHPGLVVPLAAALLVAAYVALPWRRLVPEGAAVALGLAGLVTLTQYAVPLALVVGVLVVLGGGALASGVVRSATGSPRAHALEPALAAGLLGLATLVALPSAGLTAACLGVVLASAVLLLLARAVPRVVDRAAGGVAPVAWAGLVWETAYALELDRSWCALVVLAGVGLVAIVLPRVEVEVAATVAVLLSVPASVAVASDPSVSLAIHLTVAGALVTLSSLVHRDRRALAVPGGLLLAAATWVRLADLGVSAPEAYTLPTALVLLGVGLDRLRRDPAAPTTAALLPGLLLGTVPSLLWALGEPVSFRALALGLACLALVVLGASVRWSAPVVVGAAVGATLVLRELAPYAAQTPQWVVIGLAGTLLTVVGVTWERRLADLHHAGAALGRLR